MQTHSQIEKRVISNTETTKRAFRAFVGLMAMIFFVGMPAQALAGPSPKVKNESTGQIYTDLTVAINAATPGDSLELRGTFVGNFTITKNLMLEGVEDAVLDGGEAGTVLTIPGDIDVTVGLKNLTIQNGFSTTTPGGGINCTITTPSSLTLEKVKLVNNAGQYGGGLYFSSGNLIATECYVANNTATSMYLSGGGGGIYIIDAVASLSECEIEKNAAIGTDEGGNADGGGIFIYSSVCGLSKLKVKDNTASANGGGIAQHNGNSITTIQHCYIYRNIGAANGGGFYLQDSGDTANLIDTDLFENRSNNGGGIFAGSGTTLVLVDVEANKNRPNDIVEF